MRSPGARNTFGAMTAALIALALCTGCGRTINRSAERHIRDALPNVLGPARQYRVHIENAPDRTLDGKLALVTVDGDDVQFSNGLLLDRLHLDLKDVDYDTVRQRLRRIGEARFSVSVGEKNLDEFMAGEAPEGERFRHVHIKLTSGQVTISGDRVVLGLGVPFRMTGPLKLAGPQRIEIDPNRLTVVGITVAGLPLRFLKGRFDSAIDLSALSFPVTVTGAQSAGGLLTLTGQVDAQALLSRAQDTDR